MTLVNQNRHAENYPQWTISMVKLKSKTVKVLAKVIVLLNVTFCLVSSSWMYHTQSRIRGADKDFKQLNKTAISNKATTAHVSEWFWC